jgi:replicative DNA helicase
MTPQEPHDLAAERAVLGAMMNSAAAAEACRQALVAGDFYRPAHGVVFGTILALMRENTPADWVTVKDRLESDGELRGNLDALYVHTLTESAPAPVNGPHYAGIVRGHAVTRRVRESARRVVQMSESGDTEGLTERAIREFEAIRDAGIGAGLTVQTIMEFLGDDEEADAYDWVIPGLIERGDRLMLTGAEGAGKSTLFRQMAVMAASGVHPFTLERFKPVRVLILDFQDTPLQTRRKLRPLVTQARLQGHPVDEANLWIECRWQGVDLMRDKDLSWLLRQVSAVMPDIVFLGPLKGMAPRALHTDDEASPIIAALDMVRARGCALVLEAHSGHQLGVGGRRDVRPRGSSQFLAWPEFGYGLRWSDDETAKLERTVDMVAWRGDRDERQWPEMLTAGGTWPWRVHQRLAQSQWGAA